MYRLALCYQDGRGVNQDYDQALTLLQNAAKFGIKEAKAALERLNAELHKKAS